jgi:NTE family protein
MKADLVFEGGGVKGIGLVGAYSVLEKNGYVPANVAGTSAGAIVGSLVAAGYSAGDLRTIMNTLDYWQFMDPTLVDRLPLLGKLVNLLWEEGVYKGDFAETWIRELLAKKGIHTFKDLIVPDYTEDRYKYKLNVITADLTHERLVVLPQGIAAYGIDPDDLEVAKAVRMSMSIPFFFEPVVIDGAYFVDGGLLSNFPIWLFDAAPGVTPEWPTFGMKLVEPRQNTPNDIQGPIGFLAAMVRTMLEAHDNLHVENDDMPRTIMVPTGDVHTTDFGITASQRANLFASGVDAAEGFFATWDFEKYKEAHRANPNPNWIAKVTELKSRIVLEGHAPQSRGAQREHRDGIGPAFAWHDAAATKTPMLGAVAWPWS